MWWGLGSKVTILIDKPRDFDRDFEEAKEMGGLIQIVDSKKHSHHISYTAMETGRIVAIGPYAFKDLDREPEFKIGDHVLFMRGRGEPFKVIVGKKFAAFRVMDYEDVYCLDDGIKGFDFEKFGINADDYLIEHDYIKEDKDAAIIKECMKR